MAKKEYRFNPRTLTYEVVTAPFKLRTYRLLRRILIVFILASLFNGIFSNFFFTPKMYRIDRDNGELVLKYRLLQDRVEQALQKIDGIRHRDNFVYRALFAADSLALPGAWVPYSDEKYARLRTDEYGSLMIDTWQDIDALARRLYLSSRSMDELQIFAKNKENMSLAIPAILPIDRTPQTVIYSFGLRMHPIKHRIIFHKGVDITARTGDPVYATGNATVKSTNRGLAHEGYGRQVLLNHDYGYQTRYAHLSRILVAPGDRVMRGQLIGLAGSTGGTTGPHVHYEVIHMGQVVNPMNYFNKNMSPEEYEEMINSARASTLESE